MTDDLLAGGGASASFPTIGTTVRGRVLAAEAQQQKDIDTGEPKCWPDGKPMMQLVITVQTDERDASIDGDDGQRRIYARGNMLKAIREATRKAGITSTPALVGADLAVKYVGDGEPTKRGFNPPKLYAAQVTPGVPATDLLGGGKATTSVEDPW